MINTSGVLQATYSYDPWGNVTATNLTNNTVTNLQPYRFAGGFYDRSTGYLKFGMRYYDPGTGRFTQQDNLEVLGDPSRANRYEYAGDNPANFVDPSGADPVTDWLTFLPITDYLTTVTEAGTAGMATGAVAGCIADIETGCLPGAAGGALLGAIGGFVGGTISYFQS